MTPDAPTGARAMVGGARPTAGVWCSIADPMVLEIVASAGFDWACVDAQHGAWDESSLTGALHGLPEGRAETLVRVAANDAARIGRALDAGAGGVIVPMVENAAQAAQAVAACRYPPEGTRSWGPLAGLTGRRAPGPAAANAGVACVVMVETPAAVEQAAKIAAVAGVDAIFAGPYDLALACGTTVAALLLDRTAAAPLARIVRACTERGITAGAFGGTEAHAAALRDIGFRMIATVTDTALLARGAAECTRQGPGRPVAGYGG